MRMLAKRTTNFSFRIPIRVTSHRGIVCRCQARKVAHNFGLSHTSDLNFLIALFLVSHIRTSRGDCMMHLMKLSFISVTIEYLLINYHYIFIMYYKNKYFMQMFLSFLKLFLFFH